MLSTAARANLTVVLVNPRNPNNIGAAARAMQDFGFSDLRIVNTYAAPFEAAQLEAAAQLQAAQALTNPETPSEPVPKSAVAAASVMQNALRFNTLPEAISDCTLIAATTAIGARTLSHPVLTLQQPSPTLLNSLQTNKIALLFGSEKTGLTTDQLSHATLLLTIPMFDPTLDPGAANRHLSMNLGQSVAVCLYELTRAGFEHSKQLPQNQQLSTTAADRELLTQLLLDVMHVTEYKRRFPANATETHVRQLTQSLGHSHQEAESWMGILRQILWSHKK